MPAVKGYYRGSWLTAHETDLQAELMRGEMGHFPFRPLFPARYRSWVRLLLWAWVAVYAGVSSSAADYCSYMVSLRCLCVK